MSLYESTHHRQELIDRLRHKQNLTEDIINDNELLKLLTLIMWNIKFT